jgi:hypothetical protein
VFQSTVPVTVQTVVCDWGRLRVTVRVGVCAGFGGGWGDRARSIMAHFLSEEREVMRGRVITDSDRIATCNLLRNAHPSNT